MDGLEKRIEGRAAVARVNIFGESGGELAGRYNVSATPTYLLLDGKGNVIYRKVGGMPDADVILEQLAKLERPGAVRGL